MKFFAEWSSNGVFVFFPTVAMTWQAGFLGGTSYRLGLSWIMGAVGIEWARG
jgi:hypothetical protein